MSDWIDTATIMFVAIFTVAAWPIAPIFTMALLLAWSTGSTSRSTSSLPPM